MSIYEIKEEKLSNYIEKGKNIILNSINSNEIKLNSLKESYIFNTPNRIFENKNNRYNNLIDKLSVLNPLNTLKRGYTITKINDNVITNINKIKINDEINVTFENGNVDAKVINVKEN